MSMEQKEHLKDLLNLPSLAVLEKRRGTLKQGVILVAGHQYTEADLELQIEQWRLRDAIQATRPEGCWCLGLGGKGQKWSRSGLALAEIYCSCPEGKGLEKVEREALAAHTKAEAKRIEAQQWAAADIPARFREFRLETSPLCLPFPALIHRLQAPEPPSGENGDFETKSDLYISACKQWMGSWFFYGPYGSGKTGLAVGLAYARLKDGERYETELQPLRSIRFITCPGMLSELRSTYGQHGDGRLAEQDVLRKYIGVDLLILDDLGAEQVKDTGWVEDRLYQVIGQRHDELRSTIFTSNFSLEQLAQRIGERIVWRIAEMCGPNNIIEVNWKNLRLAIGAA